MSNVHEVKQVIKHKENIRKQCLLDEVLTEITCGAANHQVIEKNPQHL